MVKVPGHNAALNLKDIFMSGAHEGEIMGF
jgi:hypothetical protein